MTWININKVELENTDDSYEAMASVVLLYSSLMYDCIKEGKYKEALDLIPAITNSSCVVENQLRKQV